MSEGAKKYAEIIEKHQVKEGGLSAGPVGEPPMDTNAFGKAMDKSFNPETLSGLSHPFDPKSQDGKHKYNPATKTWDPR